MYIMLNLRRESTGNRKNQSECNEAKHWALPFIGAEKTIYE